MKYVFRGIVVFEYDPETKSMFMPSDEVENGNFNFCKFIPDDYALFSNFFNTAYQHSIGMLDTRLLKDIEVN